MTSPLRVWGWTADSSGCQAYRIRFPFDAVKAIRPQHALGYGTTIIPQAKEHADVVIAQRICLDAPSTLWQRWARQGQKKLIVELDDDLWNIDPANERAYYFFANPKIQANLVKNIQVAHAVTVSTPELAEMVQKKTGHQNIHIIRNAVPAWLLEHEPQKNHHVGWGGSPSHHGDFGRLRRGMYKFLQRHRDKTFHTIGMDYGSWMKLPEDQCHFTPWVPSVEDFFRTIDYSVGVAPLADTVFNAAKSDIKFLELAALGIPTIASDVPAYRSIENGWTGLLVEDDREWGRLLKMSVEEPEVFWHLGQRAKRYVAHTRTTAHTAMLWAAVIEG